MSDVQRRYAEAHDAQEAHADTGDVGADLETARIVELDPIKSRNHDDGENGETVEGPRVTTGIVVGDVVAPLVANEEGGTDTHGVIEELTVQKGKIVDAKLHQIHLKDLLVLEKQSQNMRRNQRRQSSSEEVVHRNFPRDQKVNSPRP